MKSTLAAVKRQRFPSQASRRVRGLFILSLGSSHRVAFLVPQEEEEGVEGVLQVFLIRLPL